MLTEKEINNLVQSNNELKEFILEMVEALETSSDLLNLSGYGHNTVVKNIGLITKANTFCK